MANLCCRYVVTFSIHTGALTHSLFIQNHCTLRLEPQYNVDELPPMDEDMLDYFRMYIEDLRHAEYEIPEQVSEVRAQQLG